MKTTKLVIGIVSIVLFFIVIFQSCAVGLGNAIEGNSETSGAGGTFLAFFMLIAGIITICCRKSKGGSIVAAVFYAFGGVIGISNVGSFGDLKIWSYICFIFAAVIFIGSLFKKKILVEDDK